VPRNDKHRYDEAVELSSIKSPALGMDIDYDPDVDELNNPDVEALGEPPLLGVRPKPSDMFGEEAETFGRATSPKLYAQAAQFPTAVQFRVWRWENGVPVALGAIGAESTEEDFVRQFYNAMPVKGEGRFQFRMRPIDIRGKELGKEFTINISEHHSTVAKIRARKEAEMDSGRDGYGYGRGDVIVQGGGENGGMYAEEMGRMFEQAVESAERRTEVLQETLEQERERLRAEEKVRAEERVSTAERSATVVQTMTEKLMNSDRLRSDEAMRSQKEHGTVMMNTMTTVFQQQQEAQRNMAERMRQEDARRQTQDREFYDRQRQEVELQRQRDRDDYERQKGEREAQRKHEMEQLKVDAERRKGEEQLRVEQERERIRGERDRWKQELEEKRLSDQRDWERRREEEERRRERERSEWERRETIRREESSREQDRRKEEILLQQKQMELSSEKDRQHAERMMEMSRMERESQRESQINREKLEREAREMQDRDRQRQHEMGLKEMEMSKDRDREHQERMMKLHSTGMGGLKDMLGMETPELLSRIFGAADGEGGGWSEAIPKVLGSLAEMGKVALSQAPPPQAEAPVRRAVKQERQVAIQTPEGVKMIPASLLEQMQARMAEEGQIPLPDFPLTPPHIDEGLDLPISTSEDKKEPTREESDFEKGSKVNTLKRAKEAGVSLQDQKKARKAARKLVSLAASRPSEDWAGLTIEAVGDCPELYPYIKAVSVYAALAEAQADEEIALRIVDALKESGLTPPEIAYTEEEWEALQGGGDEV